MKKFAFISRHTPTPQQVEIAKDRGIELVHVGDRDAFGGNPLEGIGVEYTGVVCVHALIGVLALKRGLCVGVFENISRPGPDGKPQFTTGKFAIEEP